MLELVLYDFARSDGTDHRCKGFPLLSEPSLRANSYSISSNMYFYLFIFFTSIIMQRNLNDSRFVAVFEFQLECQYLLVCASKYHLTHSILPFDTLKRWYLGIC